MDTIELLSRLVAIDSVNPSLVPGGAGEGEIAAFVAAWARGAGLEAEVLERAAGARAWSCAPRGSGGGRTLLLCGHLDTVGVEGMTDPFVPRVDGDRLYGRGAYDMKAGLAAALVACREAACARARAATSWSRRSPTRSTRASASRRCWRARARGRRDRHRADRAGGDRRPQGLRLGRDRGARPRRARLAAGPGRRRDRRRGAGADRGWASSTRRWRRRRTRCSGAGRCTPR